MPLEPEKLYTVTRFNYISGSRFVVCVTTSKKVALDCYNAEIRAHLARKPKQLPDDIERYTVVEYTNGERDMGRVIQESSNGAYFNAAFRRTVGPAEIIYRLAARDPAEVI